MMKKLAVLVLFAGVVFASCTKTEELKDPNIYGTWNIGSILYETEIDLQISKLPVSGESKEASSLTFNKDMTCSYDITVKTEEISILGQTIPSQSIPLKDTGTFTFTKDDNNKVLTATINNSQGETLVFTVLSDTEVSQQWKTTSTYDVGVPVGELDIDLTLNMTR